MHLSTSIGRFLQTANSDICLSETLFNAAIEQKKKNEQQKLKSIFTKPKVVDGTDIIGTVTTSEENVDDMDVSPPEQEAVSTLVDTTTPQPTTTCQMVLDLINVDDNCVVFGDFNARLDNISGDRARTPSGTKLHQWCTDMNLNIWNAQLAFGQATFTSHQLSIIIDFVISRPVLVDAKLLIDPDLDLNSDHRLLTFSWLTMDVKAPPIKSSRTIWKLQRLQEKAVAKLYVEKFRFGTSQLTEDVTEAIQQSQLSLATLDNLTTQLECCIHQALTESVSISTPRPRHWK
ncbi:hypothetical protein Unana1_06371 [Umbelopsis nana]